MICETLGLEPSAVRAALERMRAQRGNPTRSLGRTRPNVRRANRVSIARRAERRHGAALGSQLPVTSPSSTATKSCPAASVASGA